MLIVGHLQALVKGHQTLIVRSALPKENGLVDLGLILLLEPLQPKRLLQQLFDADAVKVVVFISRKAHVHPARVHLHIVVLTSRPFHQVLQRHLHAFLDELLWVLQERMLAIRNVLLKKTDDFVGHALCSNRASSSAFILFFGIYFRKFYSILGKFYSILGKFYSILGKCNFWKIRVFALGKKLKFGYRYI